MKKIRLSLKRNKELFLAIGIYLLFFISVTVSVYLISFSNTKNDNISKTNILLDNITEKINSDLNEVYDFSRVNYYNNEFANIAKDFDSENDSSYFTNIISYNEKALANKLPSSINGIGFIPYDGETYSSTKRCYTGSLSFFNLQSEDVNEYYKLIISEANSNEKKNGRLFILPPRFQQQEGIILPRIVFDINYPLGRKTLGIVFFTIDNSVFTKAFSVCSTLDGLNAFIIENNKILYRYKDGENVIDNHYVRYRYLDLDLYQIVVNYDYSYARGEIYQSILVEVLAFLGIIVTFSVLYIFLFKHFKKNTNYLFNSFEELEKNKTLSTIALTNNDEDIDRVVSSYNELVTTIENEIKEKEIITKEKQTFEMENLSMQINKHFIVNVLSVVRSMINLKNFDDAKTMLEHLSNFLRYTLILSDGLSTIENEINLVSDYLTIQKLRYKNISYSIDMDESLKSFNIPRMILQPLVENIFAHNELTNSVCISIAAYKEDEKIIIKVSNEGFIDSKVVEAVNKKIVSKINIEDLDKENSKNQNNGIALRNIYRRLNLLFENKVKLFISCENNLISSNIEIKE